MKTSPHLTVHQPILHLPAVHGIIERRLLVNYRCAPEVLTQILPAPFRPKLINGWGLAGICLIRLGQVRPSFLPARTGLSSENAAHRIAVTWEEDGVHREGVFIPRRDTNSLLNQLAGGRLFPGVHHRAQFRVWETEERFKVEMRSDDGVTFMRLAARTADTLAKHSIFTSLEDASNFFRAGSLGWSARDHLNEFDGLELRCDDWQMQPLAVERAESSFFSNVKIFPRGSVVFDSAFLMRNLNHSWLARGKLKLRT